MSASNLFTIISLLVNRMLAATVVIESRVRDFPASAALIVRGAIQRDFPIVQGRGVRDGDRGGSRVNLIADLLCGGGRSEDRGHDGSRAREPGVTGQADAPFVAFFPLARHRFGARRWRILVPAGARDRRDRRAPGSRPLCADCAGTSNKHAGARPGAAHLPSAPTISARDIFSRLIYGRGRRRCMRACLAVTVARRHRLAGRP